MLPFALNHMTARNLGWEAFLDLSKELGCVGVEFRNDLPGPLFGGADPATVGAAVNARGLRFWRLPKSRCSMIGRPINAPRLKTDGDDLLGNVTQIRALRAAGYQGPISYQPFAPSVHALRDPKSALDASMEFILQGVAA